MGMAGRGPVLRRCRDHAGDLGAVGGRGPEARDARLRELRPADRAGDPGRPCSPCRAAAPARSRPSSARSRSLWFLDHGGPRASSTSPTTGACFLAFNPYYGVSFLVTHPGHRLRGARQRLPRRHGRGGALCRSRPFRPHADPGGLGRRGLPGAGPQLSRPGRAAAVATPRPSRTRSSCWRPRWLLLPLVILATLATIVASQAVITGAFSLTRQAIQLGLLPRLEVRFTSETHQGQIYLPRVNCLLLLAVVTARGAVRLVEQPGQRLRHRGVRHHGGDDAARQPRDEPELGLGAG